MRTRADYGARYRGALAGALALVALACAPAAPPGPTVAASGSARPPTPTARAEPASAGAPAATPAGAPERTDLKLGLSSSSPRTLSLQVAAGRGFGEEGLNVEMLPFNSDAEVNQALASDSVDIALPSLNGLLNLISAGQPVKAFYAGINQADFEWFALREIRRWDELRGKRVGIGSHGGLTDFLTRHALRKHGLEPERDVQMVQVGSSATGLQALRAGRIEVAVLTSPFNAAAVAEGFTRIGTQAQEVTEEWPRIVFVAKEKLLGEHPNTVRALLRAHVKGLRTMRADREAAVRAMMETLKYERQAAERTYDDIISGFDERGRLPAAAMPLFWEIAVAAGEVTEAWPEARFLDRRFIDTFDDWAPR